jgi:hypothetical protein
MSTVVLNGALESNKSVLEETSALSLRLEINDPDEEWQASW